LSLDEPFNVYALAEPYEGHPAGSIIVIAGQRVWIEPRPIMEIVIVPKGETVPGRRLTASAIGCQMCALCDGRHSVVDGVGAFAGLMIIAEAPGKDEDLTGSPFVGESGKLLKATLAEMGLQPNTYYLTNAVRCRPPDNRDPERDELDACRFWLEEELARVQPKWLLILGKVAKLQIQLYLQEHMIAPPWGMFYATHPAALLRNPSGRPSWRRRQIWPCVREVLGLPPEAPAPVAPYVVGEPEWDAPYLAVDTETDSLEDNHAESIRTVQISDGESGLVYRRLYSLALPAGQVRLRRVEAGRQGSEGTPLSLQAEMGSLPPGRWQPYLPHNSLRELATRRRREPERESSAVAGYWWQDRAERVVDFRERRYWYAGVRFDAPKLGVELYDFDTWDDIQLIAYVLRYPRVGLKALGPELTGLPMEPITALIGTGQKQITFPEAMEREPQRAFDYALRDAVVTSRLAPILYRELKTIPTLYKYYIEIEKPIVPVVYNLEQEGVLIDNDALARLKEQLTEAQAKTKSALDGCLGLDINPNSGKQLAQALIESGVPLRDKTPTGAWSTDEDSLLALCKVPDPQYLDREIPLHYLVSHLLEYREYGKLIGTYCKALLEKQDASGRVHPSVNQAVTATNRFSYSDPSMQNIPARGAWGKPFRRVITARPGHVIVKADFSQLELRILAHYTRERLLVDAYTHSNHDTAGKDSECARCDVHQAFATEWGVTRSVAKNGVFAMAYMSEAETIARTIGVPKADITPFLTQQRAKMPALLGGWKEHIRNLLTAQGYVETLYGWRNYYPLFRSPIRSEQAKALREAGNCPIQGTAGGILKKLLLYYDDWRRTTGAFDSKFVLMVHDEVVFEVPKQNANAFAVCLADTPAAFNPLSVPLKLEVQIGPNWGSMVPWERWTP
jgi:uracil-DNA glycosylase family 4